MIKARARLSGMVRGSGLRWLALVVLSGWALLRLLERMGGPEVIRAEYGIGAAALLVPAHAIVAVSPLPGEVVALAHGAIYGFVLGSVFTWSGWMGAALLEYGLFRRIASDVAPVESRSGLPRWVRRFPAHHPAFLGLARLLPFGNHVVNAVAGSHRVPLWRFCWPTALALAPISIGFAAVASGVVQR